MFYFLIVKALFSNFFLLLFRRVNIKSFIIYKNLVIRKNDLTIKKKKTLFKLKIVSNLGNKRTLNNYFLKNPFFLKNDYNLNKNKSLSPNSFFIIFSLNKFFLNFKKKSSFFFFNSLKLCLHNFSIFSEKNEKYFIFYNIMYNKKVKKISNYFRLMNLKLEYLLVLIDQPYNFNFIRLQINYKIKNILFSNNKLKIKTLFNFNINYFLNFILFINDRNVYNNLKKNYNFLSNNILSNFFNFFDYDEFKNFKYNTKFTHSYNNYYPIVFSNKISYKNFFSNFKNNYNIDFAVFTNRLVISFLEKNFKKFIYIKYINNFYNKFDNYYLNNIISDYKRFQPAFWKNFLVKDFIKIFWYSLFLKDLSMISEWISIFMEVLHFKNHKKFLSFLSNFTNKYSDIFINVLKIKGFFFDIRGKVGVTGSSKKRHIFIKFGSINKSSKKTKINFNQNLVRTYSGVMGLTYIINY